jgi:hypothetical protein
MLLVHNESVEVDLPCIRIGNGIVNPFPIHYLTSTGMPMSGQTT